MTKPKTPQIRFHGFTDEWEEKILGEIAPLQRGFDLPISQIIKGNIPIVYSNGILNYNIKGKCIAPGIVTGRSGTIGKFTYVAKGEYWPHNTTLWVTNFNNNIPKFIFYLYQTINISRFGTGSGVPTLNRNDVHEKSSKYPKNITEQTQIGNYFQKIDDLIAKTRNKLDKLKSMKQACLSKMFPQRGATTPQIRFSGFSDEWEEKKIKEFCNINTGKSNTQDQVPDGLYPFYIRSDFAVKSNKYLYDCEAVLTIGDGNIGKVFHYINGKFDLHQRVYKMSDFIDIDGKYFYYYFSTMFYERAMKMTAKATVDSIRLEMISEMDILKPKDKEEQQNIANLFTHLDNLIALNEKQLGKLQNIKASCLDKMFVNND